MSGGVPEPAECELEAIAALLLAWDNAGAHGDDDGRKQAAWLFERGVRIQEVRVGGVPKQSLRDRAALDDIWNRRSSVWCKRVEWNDPDLKVAVEIAERALAALERPRPALPAPETPDLAGPWRISPTRLAMPDGQWSIYRVPVTDATGIIHPQITVANARTAAILRDALNGASNE